MCSTYLNKNQVNEQITRRPCTRNIGERCWLKHAAAFKKMSRIRHHQSDLLTARERQIVRVMAEGLSNKEIAQRLRLAEGTVKVHLHRIYRKLGIGNRTALAILAHTHSAKQVH